MNGAHRLQVLRGDLNCPLPNVRRLLVQQRLDARMYQRRLASFSRAMPSLTHWRQRLDAAARGERIAAQEHVVLRICPRSLRLATSRFCVRWYGNAHDQGVLRATHWAIARHVVQLSVWHVGQANLP